MTLNFTDDFSKNGVEPTELLRPLALEYIAELARNGQAEILESTGIGGIPVIIVVIPNVKVQEGHFVDANTVPTVPTEEKDVPKTT